MTMRAKQGDKYPDIAKERYTKGEMLGENKAGVDKLYVMSGY